MSEMIRKPEEIAEEIVEEFSVFDEWLDKDDEDRTFENGESVTFTEEADPDETEPVETDPFLATLKAGARLYADKDCYRKQQVLAEAAVVLVVKTEENASEILYAYLDVEDQAVPGKAYARIADLTSLTEEETAAWQAAAHPEAVERRGFRLEPVVFGTEDFFEDSRENCRILWVVPNAQKNAMEPILITILPRQATRTMLPHEGEEFGYVLSGSVILEYGGRKHRVHRGETFYIRGDQEHCLRNSGASPARVLWITTPPSF